MNSVSGCVLVVEDEDAIRRLLWTTLCAHDYRVYEATSVAAALDVVQNNKIDLIILDLGLSDGDGIEVINAVRPTSQVPIVVVSARSDERGKVAALDAGADDYITKPFGAEELMARIRAAFRHQVQQQGGQPVFCWEGLTVDLVRRVVSRDGVEVKLSPKEYNLLQPLVIHAGKVLTHHLLMREAWGTNRADDISSLRVYIRLLRNKLENDPDQPTLILTEPGVGYRLRIPDDESASRKR
jgi:two-component system KDP operon response regulator KdpE